MKKVQKLYLQLIEETCFNNFDGKQIAKDLRENLDAWDGVFMTRKSHRIILRDLPEYNRVNILHIRFSPKYVYTDNPLYKIAESTWGHDEAEITDQGYLGTGVCMKYWWA